MARSGVRPQPRRWALALLFLARPCVSHWHEEWEAGQTYSYPWYEQPWVGRVNTFYCDEDCAARLEVAPTVDREFKALVELLNQTTGGPRNPYRGAFEGLPCSRQVALKEREGFYPPGFWHERFY